MAGADSANSESGSQKHFTSKRTLAIVYAVLVLSFAAGLILTDSHPEQNQVPVATTK